MVQLSEQQEQAAAACARWIEEFEEGRARRPFFVLSGFAGTGKTFCTKEIIDRLGRHPAYMAYTGKAALVLKKYAGVDATTIHSKIYKLVQVSDETFKDLYAKRDNATEDGERKEIENEIAELMKPKFVLNSEAFEEGGEDLIVLDECSMVDDVLLADLTSFDIPIIALGDPGQLPPIKGEGALFKGAPDAMLTEIRRQALDNPIVQWSMWARQKRTLPTTDVGDWEKDRASKFPRGLVNEQIMRSMALNHDVIICWKNKTRQGVNKWMRRLLGYAEIDPTFPVVGEKIIFTKNDKEVGVFNGLFGEVVEVGELLDNSIELFVRRETDDGDKPPIKVRVLRACFEAYNDPDAWERLRPWDYRGTQQADFGYCLTCHKAQGSQWPTVLIIEENVFNWRDKHDERARWLYTGITRAMEKVTLLMGKVG